jgi:hypothetical protein
MPGPLLTEEMASILQNCLVDFSVANFAIRNDEIVFLQQFLKWRETEGVIGGIMCVHPVIRFKHQCVLFCD